jgi:hypothetical protein
MKAALFLMIAAMPLAGCASTINAPIVDTGPVHRHGPVALGQAVRVGSVVVTPLDLVEDSRCPVNARCVWAGRLVINARIDGPGWRETVPLELGKPSVVRGAPVTLTSGEPGKVAGAETPNDAYRFDFQP